MRRGGARLARTLAVAWVALLAAPAASPPPAGGADAQVSRPADADLRVEWDLDRDRRGNHRLSGYVYNDRTGYYASHVQLRITGTDRSGRVVVDTSLGVYGDVPPKGRSFFETPIPSLDPTYRVTITAVDYRTYGTGGG